MVTAPRRVAPPRATRAVALRLAGVGVIVAGALWWHAATHEDVPLPPEGASPEEVVGAYVAAINGRDRETLRALSTPATAEQSEVWVGTRIDDLTFLPRDDAASPGPEETSADVPVTFVIRHGDASMTEGETTGWTYLLVRDAATGRWLVQDQGQG
ncbi:hypothetical protein [Cellulomonas sp. PhB143]|uniref:hypothetical protein n=1 Tax=Cellulomonas sp. PhB143 TaxID=2485186 RepID=UPI000F45F9F4|nr:hypothetical protein [Cellulomonas sp. PhB143]ROS74339.1 hypothetical protein EDF32_2080 [Cellulomonas sp. PhB143]